MVIIGLIGVSRYIKRKTPLQRYHSDSRILVWRERGERNHEQNITSNVAFGSGFVTVWGGVFLATRYYDLVI